jgi:hypothetical protein
VRCGRLVEFFYVFLKEAGEVPPSAGIPSEAKKPKKPVAHRYFFRMLDHIHFTIFRVTIYHYWLVVTKKNEWIMTFHSVGNFIISTDELHHFSEGLVETTNQINVIVYFKRPLSLNH